MTDELRKRFEEKFPRIFLETQKPIMDVDSMLSGGDKTIYGYSKGYVDCTENMLNFIQSERHEAYEEGKRDRTKKITEWLYGEMWEELDEEVMAAFEEKFSTNNPKET